MGINILGVLAALRERGDGNHGEITTIIDADEHTQDWDKDDGLSNKKRLEAGKRPTNGILEAETNAS